MRKSRRGRARQSIGNERMPGSDDRDAAPHSHYIGHRDDVRSCFACGEDLRALYPEDSVCPKCGLKLIGAIHARKQEHLWVVIRWTEDGPFPGWTLVTYFNRAERLPEMKRAWAKPGFKIVKITVQHRERNPRALEGRCPWHGVSWTGMVRCPKCQEEMEAFA